MNLYLDDTRDAPPGWVLVRTADECVDVLRSGVVESLSLDHDLAAEHYAGKEGREATGYHVVMWMAEHSVWPAKITLHTMNPAGRDAMAQAIRRYAPHVELRIAPPYT